MKFLSTLHNQFVCNNKTILLKGVGLGNWLNLEHFMFGLPGTDSQIRQAILESYGKEKYNQFWDKYYSVYIQEKDIAYVRDCEMNHVRIAVNYKLFYTDSFEKSVAIREIDRVLEYCKKYSIWAIIDLHAVPGGQNPDWHSDNESGKDSFWQDEKAKASIIELWEKIANYYKDESTIGGYDLINEPCYFEKETDSLLIDFFRKCTSAIRSVDKKHIIFYSGNVYSRDFTMFTENLDENCSYTFHLYPFLQIANHLQSEELFDKLLESLVRDVSFEHLTKVLQKPLWCGETGHPLHLPQSYNSLQEFISILNSKHISWALWPLKDKGSMAMTFPQNDCSWNRLCKELSNNWSFWEIFNQDSMISAMQETDKSIFYNRIATETTMAWQIVRKNMVSVPFEKFIGALDDFKFDTCSVNAELICKK